VVFGELEAGGRIEDEDNDAVLDDPRTLVARELLSPLPCSQPFFLLMNSGHHPHWRVKHVSTHPNVDAPGSTQANTSRSSSRLVDLSSHRLHPTKLFRQLDGGMRQGVWFDGDTALDKAKE
jgi:hypothetical protein